MDRHAETRELLSLSTDELIRRAGKRLVVTDTLDELYTYLATRVTDEFAASQTSGPKAFIVPVGPLEPYRIMAEIINFKSISLKNVWLFFMDEYCTKEGKLYPPEHPLSFRGKAKALFFDRIRPELLMPMEQVTFPEPEKLAKIPGMIEKLGGIELCYGGIGIHGHIAFNEPEPGVLDSDPRMIRVNDFTRTIDSTRGASGGNLVNFPEYAVTLGMKQCLSARKMLLMTRNEIPGFNWANTVARISALGEPGWDYPVTYTRHHPDCVIATDRNTAAAPKINI